jgi:CHAT domain-containing protein
MGRPSYSGSAAQSTASLSTTEMKAIATRGEEVNKDAYSYYLGSTIPTDLPATEVEVDEIGKLLHSTESVFKHEKATKHRVKDYSSRGLLKGYKYLHFATHGFVSDELPALSALVLAPDEGSKEDGFLTVGEVYGLELTSDLVTLSACELGLGKLEKGEGVIGFTRAFMYAGTPSVAVSLWSVADDRTAVLMQDFYKNMANGMPRDRALQQAQVSMIHQADSKNTSMNRATQPVNSATESANHPYFWAPFVLYGTSK